MLQPLALALAVAAAVAIATTAVAARSAPVALDVGCKTDADMKAYRACTADCKKTSDEAQKACNRTYRDCRAGCSGDDKRACRRRCRTAYRECSTTQRDALKKCRADCLEDSGCEHIPGTPE